MTGDAGNGAQIMPETSVRVARQDYFKENGLPEDGGYEDKWVPLMFGFLTFFLYNSPSRKQAVPLHDIHHVVTGYKSSPRGEAEISAWELAAGVHNKHFARLINLAGLFYGAYLFPTTTFRAYVFGRSSNTLYDQPFSEALLDEKVETLRLKLLPQSLPRARLGDYLSYIFLVAMVSLPAICLVLSLALLVMHSA